MEAAQNYVENFGFRNIQDLVLESMREKTFERNEYDESFSEKEVGLIDSLISMSVKAKDLVSEEELDQKSKRLFTTKLS